MLIVLNINYFKELINKEYLFTNKRYKLLRIAGGKFYLLPSIRHYMAGCRNINRFVDVFGGGATVVCYIQECFQDSLQYIYNDIDSNLFNFFAVLRNNTAEFLRLLELTPYSREMFNYYKENYEHLDKIEKAVAFYYILNTSYSSKSIIKKNVFLQSYSSIRNDHFGYLRRVKGLIEKIELLKQIMLENEDYKFIIGHYDEDATFFYLDPPYLNFEFYNHNFNEKDYETLFEMLSNIEGRFLLNHIDNPFIISLAEKYNFKIKKQSFLTFMSFKDCSNKLHRNTRIELFISNFIPQPIFNNTSLDKFLS